MVPEICQTCQRRQTMRKSIFIIYIYIRSAMVLSNGPNHASSLPKFSQVTIKGNVSQIRTPLSSSFIHTSRPHSSTDHVVHAYPASSHQSSTLIASRHPHRIPHPLIPS